jgi:outer membrane lipoprotein carrier protein
MQSVFLVLCLALSGAAAADLPTTPAAAQAGDAKAIVQAVEAKYAGVETLSADFVQTTRSEVFGDEKQKGRLFVKRPSKMRWEFTESGKQFVTDGRTMWVYSKEDNQAIRFDDVSNQADAAQSLLQSLDKLDELFLVQTAPAASAESHALDLRPRTEGQVKRIRLVLDKQYLLQHVTITDAFDGVTELEFSAVNLGADAPDALFDFKVPEGAQVITGSGM